MISQAKLVERFYAGETNGVASNMSICTTDEDGVGIMGYGHAVYAYRPPDMRFNPVVFVGWYGASSSTNKHINLINRDEAIEATGRPGSTDIQGDPSLEYLTSITGDDKDYSTPHNDRREGLQL